MARKYRVDVDKLKTALESKRRRHNHPWALVSLRSGIAVGTLTQIDRRLAGRTEKKIDGDVLAGVLMYLERPITDFIVEIKKEVVNDAYSQSGNDENRGPSATGIR